MVITGEQMGIGNWIKERLSRRAQEGEVQSLVRIGTYGGEPQRRPEEGEWFTRIAPEKLCLLYIIEPTFFRAVNTYAYILASMPYRVDSEDEKAKEIVSDFCERTQLSGKIEEIVRHQGIIGNSFVELIKNAAGRIVDLLVVENPQTFDFIRGSSGGIEFDEQGLPRGYEQKLANEIRGKRFSRDDLVHFKLFTAPSIYWGIGLIEPLYKTALRKLNIEEALAEVAHKRSAPIAIFRMGVLEPQERMPTAQERKDLEEQIKNLTSQSYVFLPPYIGLDFKSPEGIERVVESLKHFNELMATGLGMPPTILGLTDTPVGAARSADVAFERNIRAYLRSLSRTFEREVFARLLQQEGIEAQVHLRWGDLSEPDKLSRARRLGVYARAGLLSPDPKLENWIRQYEDLPEREEAKAMPALSEEELRHLIGQEMERLEARVKEIVKQELRDDWANY